MKQNGQNTINHTIDCHCGLDPQSPTRKESSSRLGDGGSQSAMTIKALAMIIMTALMVSCEKEIEFNGEQSDPKLVINSLVEPGQRVEACISKSYFFLNTPNTAAPEDLVATLYVNGNRIGEMTPYVDTIWELWGINDYHLVPSYYNDYCPQAGDIVKIIASANGFEDAEGTTSVLPSAVDCQMEVEVVDWSGGYWHQYNYETQEYEEDSVWDVVGHLNLIITVTDPNPGKTDCFRLITSKNNGIRIGKNRRYISFDYDDPIFGANVTENGFIDASDLDTRPEGVFIDMIFDGSSYRIKVKVYFECLVDEDFDPDFFRAPFMVEHLSKEYYNYLNTCNQGEVALQIYSEPIQTYSNVTNGFGIVAGRAVDTLWLPLPLEE